MGRFGIGAGVFAAALALAIPLVSGGGIGASSPVAAGSGPAAPSTAERSVGVASSSIPVIEATATRVPAVVESPGTGATDGTDTAGAATPADDVAAPLDYLGVESAVGSDAPPWVGADKEAAPNIIGGPYLSTDPDTIARVKDLASRGLECPGLGTFTTSGAPSARSAQGVPGTTSADLVAFATQYNLLRYQNCLPPVSRFIYDSCMEQRLFWMAESPSPDPLDAWGHIGSVRIDGVPSVGCDGNLAGGSNNTGTTVATKWWESLSHRASLYRPGTSTAGVCIALAMTHGGIDEPYSFTRAAARWVSC
ncbi:hypothetical protein Q5716_02290 [Protaetiibacter sp. WY-16]|uniref:SCP domain-containing protein n=1 Tax=Antiquaquibacter soli TaxID=3064523 RepID=A0ABT9BKS3_9MICO|nr:hypothetical protein [Protaetiibacter sp. WY-16]